MLLLFSIIMSMASCEKKETDPVPDENTVPDTSEEGDAIPGEESHDEEIRNMTANLRNILKDLDEKRKAGSAVVPEEQTIPRSRTMKIPVEGQYMVSRVFDEKLHHGIDFVVHAGSEVYAAFEGFIATEGYDDILGNYIIIEHGGGIMTVYCHLDSYISENETYVSQGDVIGYVGSSGVVTGPNLDFRVVINGSEIDPEPYLNVNI